MNNSSGVNSSDNRLYKRATILGVVTIVIFAIFYSINFIHGGETNKIWIVFVTCGLGCCIIFLFRRAKGILNPALSVPTLIYMLYISGSILSQRFTGFFSAFLCICGMAMMYFDHLRFLLFILLSNSITLILILTGVLGSGSGSLSFVEQLTNWIFIALASLFMYLVIQSLSKTTGKAEKAENSFKTMLSSTPDYIVFVNDLSYVTYISKPLAEFAHIEDPKMALGRPLLDIFGEMDIKLKAAEILDSRGFYEGEWELNQNGEQRHFRIISNRLLGETPGLFISLMDITQLVKARSDAEAADRAKSSFLANTSHEIRTPMNAILGMAELVLRKNITPDVYEDITNIKQAGANLLGIINDILDISKIESGKLSIAPIRYHFGSMLNDVINIIRMRAMEKYLDFIIKINSDLPSFLFGDEVRIRQVLLNLLNNAVKYTKEGSITLTIYSEALDREEKSDELLLVFEVADTGIGIKKEDLDELFVEFKQFDAAANRGVEGTGLGLAISRNLCRLMGGDITVQSEHGKGSVFRAAIPQGIKDNTPYAMVKDRENKSVVIFENREKHSSALAYNVEGLGLRFSLASGKEEFLSLLKADPSAYALISSQLFMEAREELKALGDGIKLAVLTGYDETEPLHGYHQLSMPVHPVTLSHFFNDETTTILNHSKDSLVNFIIPQARLLIVDDIATNLRVAEGLVEPYEATVDTCLSGDKAIALVKENKYDIVFMDHMMPIMDGVETTAIIREWENSRAEEERVPIIALTANAVSGMREMYLEKGFNDFLSKPIETEKLDGILRKWVRSDKQQLKAAVKATQETVKEDYSILIPGVDIKKGISMTGGNLTKYLKVLEIFRTDAEERLPLLNNFATKGSSDFAAFTTQVHALKSALASIGAAELSNNAASLEAAGKKEDHDFIKKELPSFAASLKKLARSISEIKPEPQTEKAAMPHSYINIADILPALISLKKALVQKNQGEIDRILEALSKETAVPDIRKAAETISDQVLMAEFEEAMKTLENIMIL